MIPPPPQTPPREKRSAKVTDATGGWLEAQGRPAKGPLPRQPAAPPAWACSPEVAAAGALSSASPTQSNWFPVGLLSGLHRHAEVKGHKDGAGRPSSAPAPAPVPASSAAARPSHPAPGSWFHRGEVVAG